MPRSPLTEAQRRAILADLDHYILGVGADHEIADDHGVRPTDVRALRASLRRDLFTLDVRTALREIGRLTAWTGTQRELLRAVLEAALTRAQQRVTMDSGARRSADGAKRRSRVPAEAREGVSGDRDPRRRLPRGAAGAAVGRRMGVGPAAERRDG